jgi:hypothetical protein
MPTAKERLAEVARGRTSAGRRARRYAADQDFAVRARQAAARPAGPADRSRARPGRGGHHAAVPVRRPGGRPGHHSLGIGARLTSTAATATDHAHQENQEDHEHRTSLTRAVHAAPDRRGGSLAALASSAPSWPGRCAGSSRTRGLPRWSTAGRGDVRLRGRGSRRRPGRLASGLRARPGLPRSARRAAAAGAGAAVICGGGFAEAGDQGVALQRDLSAIVAATGIRLLGPNTSGFIVLSAGLGRASCRARPRCRPGTSPWSRPAAASTTRSRSASRRRPRSQPGGGARQRGVTAADVPGPVLDVPRRLR